MGLKNDRFIRALMRQPVDQTPVWMMRQAGRYLPEYRQIRQQTPNFMQFCRHIEAVTEVTLQPLERFALDAAIIFSDILTVPQAMGVDLAIEPQRGPVINNPVRCQADVDRLAVNCVDDLHYVSDAIVSVKQALQGRVPLIGFAGSPWTIATYAVEGGSSKLFQIIKRMMYAEPAVLHALLEKITALTIDYLNMQIDAGVDAIQVFDSWGGVLSGPAYQAFSLRYMQHIVNGVKRQRDGQAIPVILFTKGGGQWLELLADTGCDALGLDWTADLSSAYQRVGDRVALQGNLDPSALLSTPDAVYQESLRILQSYPANSGHVFNLGHGIDRNTPIENVDAMFAALAEYNAEKQREEV